MNSAKHFLIGGAAAVAPDVALFAFAWRKERVPEAHPLVKVHRFIHSPVGLWFVVVVAWTSHVVIDWLTHE